MKRILFLLGLIALMTAACKPEPDPGGFNGGGSNDTTETLVKKYLVKECLGVGDSLIPIRIINWNDDYTKIVHITTIKSGNNHCQLEHDFTRCTCHLEEGKIRRIDYYHDSVFQCSDLFEYDELGRMVKRKVEDAGIEYLFEWDGENVVSIINANTGEEIETYGDFCDYIHPDYTLPYCLMNLEMRLLLGLMNTSIKGIIIKTVKLVVSK